MCCLGHYVPSFVCHAAKYGFDCIWLDLEHRNIDERSVETLLLHCHHYDIDCMVRAPTTERPKLYRYLEDGATGLMIPHVATKEMATMLVEAVKFPPIGNRGLDGAGLDSDFFHQGGADYPELANQETFLVVQIESIPAVENVDAIAAVPGLDGLFIGPGDLGLRLRQLQSNLTMEACVDRVAKAAAAHEKAWGLPVGTVEELRSFQQKGAQILAHGSDFMAIMHGLEESSHHFDQALEP